MTEGVEEIQRLGRLRCFFSPAAADLLLSGRADDPLRAHRRDYGAIGSVTNLSARLCGEARGGQTLISEVATRNARPGQLQSVEPVKLKLDGSGGGVRGA